tara:strand:+ start:191 stop:379 length:189 start_codon:yes stop_codon:yes gene_type:complete
MDRLVELLKIYSEQTMEIELVDLMVAELNARKDTIHGLGNQLMTIKAINAKLEQKLKMKELN